MMLRAGARGGCASVRGGLPSSVATTTAARSLAGVQVERREYAIHTFSPPPLPNNEKPVPPVVGAPPPPPHNPMSLLLCFASMLRFKPDRAIYELFFFISILFIHCREGQKRYL